MLLERVKPQEILSRTLVNVIGHKTLNWERKTVHRDTIRLIIEGLYRCRSMDLLHCDVFPETATLIPMLGTLPLS